MALERLDLAVDWSPPPAGIRAFLDRVKPSIVRLHEESGNRRIPALVSSNFIIAYHCLDQIRQRKLARGNRFCEWGSGTGVVTCLAALLEFRACGIEIEETLTRFAREMARQEGIDAEFHCGSYRSDRLHGGPGTAHRGTAESAFSPYDFDLVYIYPWPAEERPAFEWFEHSARSGTLLASYHGGGDLRLFRQS